MSSKPTLASRRGLGGLSAVIGGAAVILSVYLPWLGYPSVGSTVTGWDTYAFASGRAQWFTRHAFNSDGFSPGFTGLSVLIVGGLLVLLGSAMLLSLAGGAFRLRAAAPGAFRVLALLAFIVGGNNVASLYATGDSSLVSPEYGLFVLAAGVLIGLVSVWVGVSRARS